MASFKNVQKKRSKRTSHFSYTTEGMTSLTSPPPARDLRDSRDNPRHDARSVLSVRPDQDPVLRDVPGEDNFQDQLSSASLSSQSSEINIPPDALSKLQEIIEAQKAYLKYQEIRGILSSRQENESSRAAASIKSKKSRKAKDDAEPVSESSSKSLSLNLNSDSDKENSKSSRQPSANIRKVAKVLQDDEKSKKRKSDSPISDLVAPEDVVKEKRSVMTSPVAVQSTSAQTDNAAPDGGPADEGVTCDWAYWVKPDTGQVRPARVTIRSSRGRGKAQGGQEGRTASASGTRSQSREARPWRAGMKTSSAPVLAAEENIVEKPLPEKPWRKNMRTEPKPAEPEEQTKPKQEERAWRNNMRKDKPRPQPQPVVTKKRHYDRKEVRDFIKMKKIKEKEEREEKERQENLRKEMVKRRLTELDKLQKQISEADAQEFKKLSQSEKNLSEEGQRVLRDKLIELTEQMKNRWRERQDAEPMEAQHVAEESSSGHVTPKVVITSRKSDSDLEHSKSKSESKESQHLHLEVEDAGALSISEVSDATEIKSLSENPRNYSYSNQTNDNSRNVSHKTNDSSRTWKDRLLDVANDDTKYRSLERAENLSLSQVPTPLTDEVPERDLSDSKLSKSEKLRKIVSEVFDRHKTDLELIRNTVEDVDVPDTVLSGPVEEFVPRYPSILSQPEPDLADLTPASIPLPVPSSLPSSRQSEDTGVSDQPPQWMEVTKEDTDHERVTPPVSSQAPGNLTATVYKGLPHPDPRPSSFLSSASANVLGTEPEPPVAVSSPEPGPVTKTNNAMGAVLRKYQLPAPNNTSIPSNMAISEGLLSPSDISEVSSYAGVVNPQTYSKDKPDVLERSLNFKSQKTDMEDLTDSESTLKDIDDMIIQNSPRLQEDLEKIKKAMERRNNKKKEKKRDKFTSVQLKSQLPSASGSSVPDALHLRFLTELHQLETVNNTQRLLDELDTIKKSAFDNHRGLEEVQQEMTKQRKIMEEHTRTDKFQSAQRELQELYSSKLQMLLESQNEVTKVTSDVAKHLADLANGKSNDGQQVGGFSVVQELQTMIETLQEKQKRMSVQVSTTQTSSHSTSSREKSKTSTPSKTRTSHKIEESGKDETDGVIRSDIPSELRTLSSKPPSSILELIEQNQATGSSIQKTISEALASISESERKTKSSNITEEVEEELSTDYSSHFDDESTLKEKSFQAVLPSVSHRRKSMKTAKRNLGKELSSETSDASDKDKIDQDPSSNSLFSDTHSFSRFTLEMVNQYMEEENVRDQHKKALLKAKEKALIEKAKIKMDELNKFSEELRVKGQDDKMPNLNKKKKAILSKLKERRAEIGKMRENLRVAEKERSFLLQEQKSLLLAKQSSRKTDGKSEVSLNSPTNESEGDKISRIEVLQGLKRLDKSKKHFTNKEKKLLERSSPVSIRAEKNTTVSSALDDTENDVSKTSDVESKTGKSGASMVLSEDDSIQTQISRSRASTVRSATSVSVARSRNRHSSNDSEVEEVREAQDTLSTVSDHSDVELRIAALSEKLQTRMRTAAKLKKEQKRERKEMLRNQEVTLKKQIEKYEQLISEGFAEIASEKSDLSNESFSRPKIKSPISGKSERKGSSPRTPIITPEMPSLSSMSFVEEDIKLETEQPETPTGSTSTILASPKKNTSPSPPSLNADSKASDKISEALDDAHSSAVSSKSSSPVSKLKLIAEGKVPEILSPEKSRHSVSENFLQKSEYSSQFESSKSPSKEDKKVVDFEPQQLPLKKVSERLVDRITESLWTDILKETSAQIRPKAQVSTKQRDKTKPKSTEFTLAFDVTSSSEESTPPIKHSDSDLDLEVNKEAAENEFMDDDFGLSNIRQEAEILRLQQLRVEEEILALQRESEELGQPVPDKPPPPYQPPEDAEQPAPVTSVPPPRPEKPPQVKVVVPSRKEDIFDIIATFVESIIDAKQKRLDMSKLCFDPANVVIPEDYSEREQESCLKYHSMLFSVTLEKVQEIYKWESTEQNPPWMQQLPLAQKRFLIPKSLNALVEKVQTEVGSDLKLTKKFGKENLLVRWAGKKRDRVDEILVRELQEEEAVWVDYGEDEVEVKEQMADIILEELITDTARVFSEIQQRVKNQ